MFESSCERPPTNPSTPRPLQTPCACKDFVAMPVTRPPGRRLASDEEVFANLDELDSNEVVWRSVQNVVHEPRPGATHNARIHSSPIVSISSMKD